MVVMSAELKTLLQLNKSHVKPAAAVLTRAFRNYPHLQYYFPNELEREKITPYFTYLDVFSGIRYGEMYATSPNLEGIAIWISSDNYPVPFWKIVWAVPLPVLLGYGRYGGFRMRHIFEHVDAIHQRLAPFKHLFLLLIGVDPKFQGKGYASKLLRPMLARLDEESLPCYLGTLKEANIPLYEHFGFKAVEKTVIPKTSIIYWSMLREVQ